jgi:hypothetical protein
LLTPQSQVVAISQGSATGTHSFTDATLIVDLSLGAVASNSITLAGNGYTEGQSVVYAAPDSSPLGGLSDGGKYLIHLVSASSFQLQDPTSHALVALSVPAGISVIGLTSADASSTRITSPDSAVGSLTDGTAYYVIKIDCNHIRLVDDAGKIAGAKAILFTGLGQGTQTIASQALTSGIGVRVTLTDTTTNSAAPSIGDEQPNAPPDKSASTTTASKQPAFSLSSLFAVKPRRTPNSRRWTETPRPATPRRPPPNPRRAPTGFPPPERSCSIS